MEFVENYKNHGNESVEEVKMEYNRLYAAYYALSYENEGLKQQLAETNKMVASLQAEISDLKESQTKPLIVERLKTVVVKQPATRKRKIDDESFDYNMKDSASRKEKQRAMAEVQEVLSRACRENPVKKIHLINAIKSKLTEDDVDEDDADEENQMWKSFKLFFRTVYEFNARDLGKNIIRLLLLAVTFKAENPRKSCIGNVLGMSSNSALLEQALEIRRTYDPTSFDSLKAIIEKKSKPIKGKETPSEKQTPATAVQNLPPSQLFTGSTDETFSC